MEQPAVVQPQRAPAAAPKPFRFCTSLVLEEAVGLRASTLPALARALRKVPLSCVYHHTHHFVLQHQYLIPTPPNEFAYWVAEVLGETPLGERLAAVDTFEYSSLHELRTALVRVMEAYLWRNPMARMRFVTTGEEFFFSKAIQVILPTPYTATTLGEFADALQRVSIHSLYLHLFDVRLRLGGRTNDFARWLQQELKLERLAEEMAQLDPYAHTLEALRAIALSLIRRELAAHDSGA